MGSLYAQTLPMPVDSQPVVDRATASESPLLGDLVGAATQLIVTASGFWEVPELWRRSDYDVNQPDGIRGPVENWRGVEQFPEPPPAFLLP